VAWSKYGKKIAKNPKNGQVIQETPSPPKSAQLVHICAHFVTFQSPANRALAKKFARQKKRVRTGFGGFWSKFRFFAKNCDQG